MRTTMFRRLTRARCQACYVDENMAESWILNALDGCHYEQWVSDREEGLLDCGAQNVSP